jgi:WhiB family redox-sensing transcriptional regulator
VPGAEDHRSQIKALTLDGMSPPAIAIRLGLSISTVSKAIDSLGLWRRREGQVGFLMQVPPDWMEDAICPQTDPDVFFPRPGDWSRPAKRICGECDVQEICLDYALEKDIRFGIWGGKSPKQRLRIAKDRVTESSDGEAPRDRSTAS